MHLISLDQTHSLQFLTYPPQLFSPNFMYVPPHSTTLHVFSLSFDTHELPLVLTVCVWM